MSSYWTLSASAVGQRIRRDGQKRGNANDSDYGCVLSMMLLLLSPWMMVLSTVIHLIFLSVGFDYMYIDINTVN